MSLPLKKKYNSFGDHLRSYFGEKVYKISIDAGFTCPNRDGKKGTGGCIYCDERGSASIGVDRTADITRQIEAGKKALFKKYKAKKYLAYFQPFTNTYAPVKILRELYYAALSENDIIGISISTRPDCVDEEKLLLFKEISERHYTWLELGLQSSHDRTLDLINRCDTYENFLKTYKKAKNYGIRVCVHIILGLPGETVADMKETVNRLVGLKVDGIKFHLLHVIRGTTLEKLYLDGKLKLFEREEYLNLICDIVRNLPPEIIIHRLSAEGPSKDVIAPLWALEKRSLLAEIERRLSFILW